MKGVSMKGVYDSDKGAQEVKYCKGVVKELSSKKTLTAADKKKLDAAKKTIAAYGNKK